MEGNSCPASYQAVGRGRSSSGGGDESEDNTRYFSDPTPQISWNKHRYQVFNEPTTWENAKARCEALGGHLATITSSLEQEQVEALLSQSETNYTYYWIGAKSNASGWLEWVTDEVLERQYSNFADGQPDGSGNNVHIVWDSNAANSSANGKWDDSDGTEAHGFICEWDDEPQAVEEAPAATDFQTWQQNPDAWRSDEDSNVPSGARPSPVGTSHLSSNPPNVSMPSLPASYDARTRGNLSPVRHQGIYETCWAFAVLGAMEADYMLHKAPASPASLDLSELHLAWFAYEASFDNFMRRGKDVLMEGGDPDIAVSFLNRIDIAPVDESAMPYSEAGTMSSDSNSKVNAFLNGKAAGSFDKSRVILSDVNELHDIKTDYANDTETVNYIKQQIMDHGAVYFRYVNALQGYDSNYSTFYSTNSTALSHAALLVGWDDDYPASNFKNNPGVNGAWLVRSSRWTDKETGELAKLGDDDYGCFWMSYAQAGTDGGIVQLRSFIVKEQSPTEDITSGQGARNLRTNGSANHTKDITSGWGARIFRASRNEKITRVSFHTTDNNMTYQLYINKFGKRVPTDPGRAELPLSSGSIAFAGYHTVTLPEAVNLYEGDYYSVILKMTTFQTSSYRYPTAVEASLDKYLEIAVNEGESFFAEGDGVPSVWQDGKDVSGGPYNACIMTFTESWTTYNRPPVITTAYLPDGTVGVPYLFTMSSSGNPSSEWRSGSLPAGLSLSKEGVLSGQPEAAGQHEIFFTAMNEVGYEEKSLTLTVNEAKKDAPEDEPEDEPEDKPEDEPTGEYSVLGNHDSGCNSWSGVYAGMLVLALAAVRRARGR